MNLDNECVSIKACLFVLSGKLLLKLFICFHIALQVYCFRTSSHYVNIVISTLKFIFNNKFWYHTLSSVTCSGTLFKRTWGEGANITRNTCHSPFISGLKTIMNNIVKSVAARAFSLLNIAIVAQHKISRPLPSLQITAPCPPLVPLFTFSLCFTRHFV